MKYGDWTVIKERAEVVLHGKRLDMVYKHLCQCRCGKQLLVFESNLKKGGSKSCRDCAIIDSSVVPTEVGKRYGKWIVIKDRADFTVDTQGTKRWKHLCRCDCGKQKLVSSTRLKTGYSTRCSSCANSISSAGKNNPRYIHGFAGKREYVSWRSMMQRCTDPAYHQYRDYGGRGITVCQRWQDVRNFIEDMGACPKDYTLERIDNSKGYAPDNCKWESRKNQLRNTRATIKITREGITLCLKDWCEKLKISYSAVKHRLRAEWSIEEALTIPVDRAANISRVRLNKRKTL